MSKLGVTERRACLVLGQHRSTQRKVPTRPDDEAALTADIVALAVQYGRYGYRRIAALLRSRRLEREPEARRADLATGGAEGPDEAAQARAALVQRRLVRPAAAGAAQPRLVLRLRRGSHP